MITEWAAHHGIPVEAVGLENDPDFELPEGPVDLAESPETLGWTKHTQVCVFAVPLDPAYEAPDENVGDGENADAVATAAVGEEQGSTKRAKRKSCAAAASAAEQKPEKVSKKAVPSSASLATAAAVADLAPSLQSRYRNYDGSNLPGLDEPIEYLQENPKKVGTAGHDRYEKYKGAKTFTEALSLGSAKGDLKHDWMKGYIKCLS